jgi:hypothetical protein
MKLFICNRNNDSEDAELLINELVKESNNSIAILRETEHSQNWKTKVEKNLQSVDFVLFILGNDTFKSNALKWEYAKSKQLNKRIIGLKLNNASKESILFCQGFQVFDTPQQCLKYLQKIFEDDRQLLLEQYKIMVGSTEKVTEQRLKVNNLFFTLTSSILSISLVIGKAFKFSLVGGIGMLILGVMAFLISFLWEKLVRSYGKLNTGKFIIIDKIEKQLRTNMFEHEWRILKEEVNYESNTDTEVKVVKRFRYFIFVVILLEITYFVCKIYFPSFV